VRLVTANFLRSEIDKFCYSYLYPYLTLPADKFFEIMLLAVTRLFGGHRFEAAENRMAPAVSARWAPRKIPNRADLTMRGAMQRLVLL
jgi:hypothetical protein